MAKLLSFNCLRWSLIILNIFYITLGLILLGLAIASKTLSYFSEPHILIGTGVCGALLVLVAILGIIGAIYHLQVALFFYMVILGTSLLLMFCISVAALATPRGIQQSLLNSTWSRLSDDKKTLLQESLDCCGFSEETQGGSGHPSCNSTMCCKDSSRLATNETSNPCPNCAACYSSWKNAIDKTLKLSGGFGMVFSFTQIIGIFLTIRYRNEKDPSINPRAFL